MKLVNLTPHIIVLRVQGNGVNYGEERDIAIPSSGLARVESVDEPALPLALDVPAEWPDGGCFDVTERKFGNITGLPEPQELTLYVVSMPVAQRAAELGRTDVFGPDTGFSAVRENGQIVAVRGLVRYQPSPDQLLGQAVAEVFGMPNTPQWHEAMSWMGDDIATRAIPGQLQDALNKRGLK
jgi:hypothetical protein